MPTNAVALSLPDWLKPASGAAPLVLPDARARVGFVIDLSRRNVREGTGGPFAAAVFEEVSGRLVAAGVNRVVPDCASIAHAEVIALALAQQRLGSYDLGAPGFPAHQLVCSCEPCLMCLGALLWSGVRGLVSAARGEDAEAIGFDEGPKPSDWPQALERRGIRVVRDALRADAQAVLRDYAASGARIYVPTRA